MNFSWLSRPWHAASLVIAIAAAYLAAGWAGNLLAAPGLFVAPQGLTAGLALAVLLRGGLRCWPGIWLGAFAFLLLTTPAPADFVPALLVATGATLQALLGARLVKPLFERENPLAREREVLAFLLLAGPLACLVLPSIAALAIVVSGVSATPGEIASGWLTLWVGNVLGVVLFAPLLMLVWPGAQRLWAGNRRRLVLPLVTTALLLIAGQVGLERLEESRRAEVTAGYKEEIYRTALLPLATILESLRGVERFFAASQEVTREEFAIYASFVFAKPEILGIDWAPRVPHGDLATFEAATRRAGMPGYQVFELDAARQPAPVRVRADHFPVLYREPYATNAMLLGLDHGFEAARRTAMDAAVVNAAYGIAVVPLVSTERHALLVFEPIYRHGYAFLETDAAARRAALRGFIVAVLDTEAIFASLQQAAATYEFAVRVTDITPGEVPRILTDSLPAGRAATWRRQTDIGNRLLRIEMASAQGWGAPGGSFEFQIYHFFALLAGLLVSFVTMTSAGRKTATDAEVAARTADLAEANARALRQERETHSLVDTLTVGVIQIDTQGIIRSVNRAVERILGFAPSEVIGRNVSLLMPEPHKSDHDGYLASYLDGGEARIIGIGREVEGLHKDGRLIPLELAVSEFEVEGRQFFTGILNEISERKRALAEIEQARRDAEQANQAKSAFLATMSHEIRTPMNGVFGMLEVLEQSSLTEHQRDQVQTMRDSAATLMVLIDDILDFSKIEAGRVDLEHLPLCVADLVEGVCTSQLSVALQRGGVLRVFVDPDLPERVLGDDTRLRQILYNLVGNAIKFSAGNPTRPGRVRVRATLVSREPLRIAFTVEDNGIGMDAAAQARLFTPFTQAEASTTRRFGGTGLGLAICRRLADLMGGEISVRSRPGQGSVFTVTLPFDLAPEQPARVQTDLSALVCCLLDDEGLDAEALARYLEHAGATVRRCADVGEVLRCATAAQSPSVLIHAEDETRRWRDGELPAQLRRVRIGHGLRGVAPDCVSIDGDALPRQTFLRAVAVAAGRASPEIFDNRSTDTLPGEFTPPPTVAQARAENRLVLVAEDDSVNQKVILQQLALLGYAAEVAGDGAEALAHWEDGGFALLFTDVHMPAMDGYQLAAEIRQREGGGSRMPIIALTANALRGEAARAKAAGMDEYLTKPVALARLRAVLAAWLPQGQAVPDSAPPRANAAAPVRALDVAVLQRLVGDDPAILHDFLSDYAGTAAQAAAKLRSAAAAKDHAQLAAIAHNFKSSSRSVGALPLGDLCAELESAGQRSDGPAVARCMAQFEALVAEVENELVALLAKENKKT